MTCVVVKNILDLSNLVVPRTLIRATSHTLTESPWPFDFEHSHWWKRRNRSKFASHYAWRTIIVYECKMDVKSTWIPTWHWMDHVSWSLRLFSRTTSWRSNTWPWDHSTPDAHNRWYFIFHHAWGPAWIKIHWNNIWLRARLHMTSHYTWGSVTTLCDFGGVLGRPLDTFFWALTISRSRLLARVWRFFWPPWSTVARWLCICLFFFCNCNY